MADGKTTKTTKTTKTKKTTSKSSQALTQVQQQQQSLQTVLAQLMKGYNPNQMISAPRTTSQSMALARLLYPNVGGQTMTQQQMRQQAKQAVEGIIGPQLKSLGSLYDRRQTQGLKSITGFTNQYMNRLGSIAPTIAANNSQALQQQGAIDASLADYVRNQGSELSASLTEKLAPVNLSQGQLAGTVGQAGQFGNIASGELAGQFGATLERMVGEGNAWQNWANALPGIGALEGMSQGRAFTNDLTNSFQEDVDGLMAQVPQYAYNVYRDLMSDRQNSQQLQAERANSILGFMGDESQRGQNAQIARGTLWTNLMDALTGMYGDQLAATTSLSGNADSYTTQTQETQPLSGLTPKQAYSEIAGGVESWLVDQGYFNPQMASTMSPAQKKNLFNQALARARSAAQSAGISYTDGQLRGIARLALQQMGIAYGTKSKKTKPNAGAGLPVPAGDQPPYTDAEGLFGTALTGNGLWDAIINNSLNKIFGGLLG